MAQAGRTVRIERVEDVRAWQMARELTDLIYDLTDRGEFARECKSRDQIRKAVGSIIISPRVSRMDQMANLSIFSNLRAAPANYPPHSTICPPRPTD